MKAISPALPAIASPRSDSAADSSAADEVFGAVIAAALGATPQPTSRSMAQPTTQSDSRRPNPSNVDRSASTRGVGSTAADGSSPSDAANDSDGPAVGARDAQPTGGGTPPQQISGTSDNASAAVSAADSAAPNAKNAPRAERAGVAAAAKVSSMSATTLDKASVALTRALAASPQDAATSAKLAAAGSMATAEPGDLIPAQLLNALPKSAPTNVVTPADGTGPAGPTAIGVPAALTVVAQPSATVLASSLANSEPVKQPGVAAKTGTATSQSAAPDVAGTDVPSAQPNPTAMPVGIATALMPGGQQGGSSSDSKDKSNTPLADSAPAPSDVKQSPTANSFAAALQVPNIAPPATIAQPQQVAAPPQPVSVPDQIVQIVAPLRTSDDGNYTIALQLHPADLGPVTVHVSVEQGVLSVHLGSDEAHGRDALTNSISDLRNQLQASGVRVAGIDVGTRASLQQGGGQNAGNQSTAGQGNQSQQQLPQHSPNGHGDRRPGGDASAFAGWNGDDSAARNGHGAGSAATQQAASAHSAVAAVDVMPRGGDVAGAAVGAGSADDVALDVRI